MSARVSLYPERQRLLVESALRDYFSANDSSAGSLEQAMSYCLFGGGKRFRPVLALLACEAVGGQAEDALPVACAVEYIHTYSLIHDDLPAIDNDDLRRNRPTCHVRFGEATAILAGDALFAEAFFLVSGKQRASSETIAWMIRELAEAAGMRGMVGGQIADIESSSRLADEETLNYIHSRKTGKLISAAAVCGARVGGADQRQLEAIRAYSEELGMAFQIVDDILDVVGDSSVLGKPVGADASLEKLTFPAVYGVELSRELAKKAAERAKSHLTAPGLRSEDLVALADYVLERDS